MARLKNTFEDLKKVVKKAVPHPSSLFLSLTVISLSQNLSMVNPYAAKRRRKGISRSGIVPYFRPR
jgi:hypothetical protein